MKLKLLAICASVACFVAVCLQATGWLDRVELQALNRMFESRQWLKWTSPGLVRLNPATLWRYHEQHEIPRRIWAWDYTLSWAIAENHPPVRNKIVIFNHMLEDEPPPDAVAAHPWLRPLLRYPTPRSTVAETVQFLAQNGAKLIILDNDFPQYADEDKILAAAIHDSATGKYGKPVPVLMASTVNRRSFSGGMQLDAMTMPVGVLAELQKLEPGVDVNAKYTGLTTILMDADQVVRRIACRIPNANSERDSIAIKAQIATKQAIPNSLPDFMDIDFAAPPNSELYPVRPFSYLLDPTTKQNITAANSSTGTASGGTDDVTVRDAIVILGDSVQDVYPTPLTNVGVNSMSGAEILAHSIETISRTSWLHRLSGSAQLLYLMLTCLAATALFAFSRTMMGACSWRPTARLAADWILCITIAAATYAAGFLWFAFAGMIVPVVMPALAVAAGMLAGVLFERESERLSAMRSRIEAMEATLNAEREMHEAEIRFQATEAQAKEILKDQQRRTEFVRRINHDLKAPVTVLNWTLAKLKREGLASQNAQDRLDHIERTSDRLFSLIAELVRTYDQNSQERTALESPRQEISDICVILSDSIAMQKSLAEMRNGAIVLDLPSYPMVTLCERLQIERVVDNLVRNALLHNPSGTTVEVSARTRANIHQITISDDGHGIPSSDLECIFTAGFTTAKEADGQGLGLSIVKSLIERLGGTVTVESEPDAGTTFTVTLPAVTSIPSVVDPSSKNPGSILTTKRK